jgi:Transcriptional regulators
MEREDHSGPPDRINTPPTSGAAGAGRPKYRVLQDAIRRGIADGSLVDSGGKLPSEHDLARQFGVAYMTVRAAVNELVTAGLLLRMHGKGTFVRRESGTAAAPPTRRLALVVPSLASLWNVAGLYYFPGIVQGFCAAATRLGYEPAVIGKTRDAVAAGGGEFGGIAGVACLLIADDDAAAAEALRDLNVPVVGVNTYRGRRAISHVAVDQAGGMAQAVHALADMGHRRVAFLPGPPGNLGAEERRQGFQRAAATLGLTAEIVTDEPADYTDQGGYVRTAALLVRPERQRPTAVVTAGDLIAAGAVRAARDARLSVPEEISVMGYGDFQVATYLQPGLSTVRLPLTDLGTQAALLLHDTLSGATRRRVVTLPTDLVMRGSVAPPATRE